MEGAFIAVGLVLFPTVTIAAVAWALRERRLRRNGHTLFEELEEWRGKRDGR